MDLFTKKSMVCVGLIVGLNTAAVYANYPSTNANTTHRSDQRTSNGHFISDQDIQKAIRDKIGPGWFSPGYEQVSAQVYNGNVTLQGSVKTWEDKEKVEKEVRNLEGVKNLNSQITVQDPNSKNPNATQANQPGNQSRTAHQDFAQDAAASPADDQLNKKIRDNVSRGWLWNSYKEVRLSTNNGNVSLEGTVDKPADQQKLVDEVQKVEGVRNVKSNLHIKNN